MSPQPSGLAIPTDVRLLGGRRSTELAHTRIASRSAIPGSPLMLSTQSLSAAAWSTVGCRPGGVALTDLREFTEPALFDTGDTLILDLLEWIGPNPRPYAEVLEAWRTSC